MAGFSRNPAAPPERAIRAALLLIGVWLLWSLRQVGIELDDGYASIANAQHFLGQSPFYAFVRGPLMGLALVPAEWLSGVLGLAPLDVRVHHAFMAVLHLGYLWGSWALLRQVQARDWPTALAWLAALPTVVFFSYAPLISHDLFPGLMVLGLVWLVRRFMEAPGLAGWLAMVALGAALPLLKQTYALAWMAVLLAEGMLALLERDRRMAVYAGVCAAAATSALLTWIGYALALAQDFADIPFWLRPYELILLIGRIYEQEGGNLAAFFQGVYLRNLSAYGWLAMLLVVPGAAFALVQGTPLLRRVALVWLLLLVALLLTPLKEVRYLAMLAPFNALLVVDLLRKAWEARAVLRWLALALLGLDMGLRLPEALRIAHPWYREAVATYFAPLPAGEAFQATLYMGTPQAFVAPDAHAFFGDRYHRITHVSIENLVALLRIPIANARKLPAGAVPPAAEVRPGDYWVMANQFVARTAPFVAGNRAGLSADFRQFIAIAEWVPLEADGAGRWRVGGPDPAAPRLLLTPDGALYGVGAFDARELEGLLAGQASTTPRLLGFRVLRLCTLDACQDRWPPG